MAGGSAHADPALLIKLARRKQMNHESMAVFAGAIVGFFCILTTFHLLRRIGSEAKTCSKKPSALVSISRFAIHLSARKISEPS